MLDDTLGLSTGKIDFIESYFSRVLKAMNQIEKPKLVELLTLLARVREAEANVFIAGNGGSASTSQHIALDWMLGTELSNPPLRVLSLAESSASLANCPPSKPVIATT